MKTPIQPEQEQTTYMDEEDTLLTVLEVAERLGVDQTTVRRWINNGSLGEGVTKLPSSPKRSLYRVSLKMLNASLKRGSFAAKE